MAFKSDYGKLANSDVEDRTNAGMFHGQQTVSLRKQKCDSPLSRCAVHDFLLPVASSSFFSLFLGIRFGHAITVKT